MNVCEFCGVKLLSDDDVYSFDGHIMCEDCYDSETRYCDCCGNRIWNDDDCGDDNYAFALTAEIIIMSPVKTAAD